MDAAERQVLAEAVELAERIQKIDRLIGSQELADRLGVKRGTIKRWRDTRFLPKPAYESYAGAYWFLSTIVAWDLAGRPYRDE